MVDYALDVSAVASVVVGAVWGHGIFEPVEFELFGLALRLSAGEPVGHYEVEHIGGVEALVVLGASVTGAKAVIYLLRALAEGEPQGHLARSRVGGHGEVQQFVVGRAGLHLLHDFHTGVVGGNVGLGNPGAFDHKLEGVGCHPHPPVWRLNGRYQRSLFGCCERCRRSGHSESYHR